ncbi:hypothetical protein V8G54_004679 [Vigna mungo]|uniref:Uncharacterized protein n=1 Tax=Vigna mungo TaxID=3915 RepID=A0AAQ3PHW4_VIGMU
MMALIMGLGLVFQSSAHVEFQILNKCTTNQHFLSPKKSFKTSFLPFHHHNFLFLFPTQFINFHHHCFLLFKPFIQQHLSYYYYTFITHSFYFFSSQFFILFCQMFLSCPKRNTTCMSLEFRKETHVNGSIYLSTLSFLLLACGALGREASSTYIHNIIKPVDA